MNDIVNAIATQLVIAMVPVIVGALAYLVRWLISYIKARTTAEHYRILVGLADQAVQAVEQTLKTKPAQEKLAAAKAVVMNALNSRGITIDELQVIAAIEAAVYNEKVTLNLSGVSSAGIVAALPEVDAAPADGVVA